MTLLLLGGLITLYAFFTHTDMFTGYAAASPAIGWNKEILYQYEKTFAEKKQSAPLRVYMTIGDVERGRPGFEKFTAVLTASNYANVGIRSKVLENTGHSGTKSETYSRGLQYVFEKPRLTIDPALLNRYAGSYELPNGNKIELKNENNQLVAYFSPTFKYNLFAASETEYYSTTEFLTIYFKKEGEKITGFDLARYGSTQFIKKSN